MTRLISNSTRSRRAASTEGGTGASAPTAEEEVLAGLVTWLPVVPVRGSLGGRPSTGRRARPRPVSYRLLSRRACAGSAWRRRAEALCPHLCRTGRRAASLVLASGSSPRGCPTPHAFWGPAFLKRCWSVVRRH